MRPFNRFTTLMAAAPVLPGGTDGGLPPVVAAPPAPQPDPAVQRMQQELTRQRAELDRMRGQVMAPPPSSAPAAPTADQHRDLIREFNRDPLSMSAAIADRAVRQALSQQGAPAMETQIEMAKQLARGQDPVQQARWDKYYGEIEAHMANVEPQYRTNTTMWANAFRMVLGQHVNDLVTEAQAAPARGPAIQVTEGGGPAAPSKASPATGATVKITPEEQAIARKFRISDAQYMQGKADNLNQSDEMLNPVGKSSWDQHITFSTRDKVRAEREEKRKANAKK